MLNKDTEYVRMVDDLKPSYTGNTYNGWTTNYQAYGGSAFKIYTYSYLPAKEVETVYSSSGLQPVSTTKLFSYNSFKQQQKVTITNSKGVKKALEYKYPHDFGGLTVYDKMLTLNMLSHIIQEEEYNIDGNNTLPLNSSRMNYSFYNFSNTQIYLSSVDTKVGNSPYETDITYQAYNSDGNILSVSKKDGPKTAYIWSYKGEHPIAKIENTEYSTVESLLGGASAIETLRTNPLPSDAYLQSVFATLRNNLTNSLITGYTYKPLVGMTSMTDASSRTTYYEYDSFQRLRYVRDQDRNILKVYCYNYAGQSIDCFAEVAPVQPVTTTIYARVELSNFNYYNVSYGYLDEYSEYQDAEVTIKLYSDVACTIPYTSTSNLNVMVETLYENNSTFSSGYYAYPTTYSIPLGTSSLSLGTLNISTTHYSYDQYYGYTYDSTTHQFYTINDGTNNYISQ